MRYYLTVDGGTTNTRVSLIGDRLLLDTVRIPLGARAGIDGGTALRHGIRDAISTLLGRHQLCEGDVCRVLASGMITSEFGLCALPHLQAPVGIAELHANMHDAFFPDITTIPFTFIRGVKTVGNTPDTVDMMRGEETELMGLIDTSARECLYVLPGSHSKLIETDRNGRIVRFSTMLTGEMIAALSGGTILRDAVDLSVTELCEEKLLDGYRYADAKGINEALFKVRILKNLFSATPTECYSFFLGAILSAEIKRIADSKIQTVVIGGKSQLRRATAILLQATTDKVIVSLSDEEVEASVSNGMIRVYEFDAQAEKTITKG